MSQHPVELIGAYADGELSAEEARRVEAHLATCTECRRELALIQNLGEAMQTILSRPPRRSVWEGVNRKITRPIGWILLIVGVITWIGLALVEWFREGELTPEWLAGTAVGTGLVLLLIGVAYEQFRDWKETPYKDIER